LPRNYDGEKKGKKKAKRRERRKMTFGGWIANSRKILCVKLPLNIMCE
jgi:hypothetical protein